MTEGRREGEREAAGKVGEGWRDGKEKGGTERERETPTQTHNNRYIGYLHQNTQQSIKTWSPG